MPLDRIDQIERSTSAADLWDATLSALADEGLDFAIYLTANAENRDAQLMTNLPTLYDISAPEDDPFLQHCCRSYEITKTGAAYMEDYPYLNARARSFILSAREHGFQSGMAIPVRLEGSPRFGGFNLGSRLDRDAFETRIWPHRERIRFSCLIVHRRMEELARSPGPDTGFRELLIAPQSDPLSPLSPREKEMIYLLARGLSRKECARMCDITPNTANEYIKSAYRKLGVRNKVEAARLINSL
ncbi:autoinducer binding domain-containing protein [Maribius pontilimi]|uniref:Autoinducer binding domain-containing protein n=1 Tax=Palleronia pontilimi TaxID=1964209 RepID=A0A934IGZ0_9RHOB|nr:LuxR family transcriptional regulator [Palleronia pontilimi]MBJ3764197.1 autoinducer binding domain-containing protein [Palleronia pontilimi]